MIDDHLALIIKQKFDEFPYLKVAGLYRMLSEEGCILGGIPCENTVRKFVNANNLKPQAQPPKPRKKFEKPHVNDLWLSDFMHGYRFTIDGVKRKLFLCGIIDDHSRLIVGARWTLAENTEALELVLKDAFLTYGLPKALYCDNGAVYASSHLHVVCARLAVALLHSKPYDSPARGKIERFWRTVRDGFLPLVDINKKYSLDLFNQLFADWLDKQYHRRIHRGIAQTPLDRYLDDMEQTTVNRTTKDELECHFYQTFTRRVKNDATVSLNATLFEVPAAYIGSKVELRHPTGQPRDVWIYEHDKPIIKILPVDPVFNSNTPHNGIQFSQAQATEDQSC
jgi:transposase InsO family protein